MERSGPDDARDDAWDDGWTDATRDSTGDGAASIFGGRGFEMFDDLEDLEDDPDAYPVAPLPPHERAWRHPSEMGEAAWVRTEPPVTIGRGLLVTSGAIGSALGVAVLYLMLPTAAGTPSAGPTVTSSFAGEPAAVVTFADDTTPAFLADPTPVSSWNDLPGITLPAADTPSTVLVMAAPETQDAPLSVAVAIEGSDYVVTTANALAALDGDTGGVRLLGPGSPDDVSPLDAELLSIDGDLAYLAPAPGLGRIELVSFSHTATADPGDSVTVLADDPAVVSYASGVAVPELDPSVIVEGTPVIDADGALVALCTVVIDADGAYVDLVPIEPATGPSDGDDVTDTSVVEGPAPATSVEPGTVDTPVDPTVPPTGSAPGGSNSSTSVAATSAWIGLRFDGAPTAAPLTVTAVVAGSPAMSAGVMVGERLLAIDGVTVSSVDDVVALVRKRQPGDVVKLTLAPRAASSATTAPVSTGPSTSAPTTTTPATSITSITSATAATSVSTSTTLPTSTTTTIGTNGTTVATTVVTPTSRTVSVVLGAVAPAV